MTDFERPAHNGSDDNTETTSTEVPATPIATTPLGAGAGTRAGTAPPRSRARWVAALAIIALVVGVTAIATLSLTGSAPASTVVGYVPADSVAYGELRLDLPGDQRQEVGEFLSKFPGFADQAALDTKLDEVLDRLLSEGTDGKQTYTRDVKPWFDGELGFSMGPIPADAAAAQDPQGAASKARALVLLSIKDEALARAWFTNVLSERASPVPRRRTQAPTDRLHRSPAVTPRRPRSRWSAARSPSSATSHPSRPRSTARAQARSRAGTPSRRPRLP